MNTVSECLEILAAQARCRDLAKHDELCEALFALMPFAIFNEQQYAIFKGLNAREMIAKAAAARWQN
jgi:hypothetical protein